MTAQYNQRQAPNLNSARQFMTKTKTKAALSAISARRLLWIGALVGV